MKRLVNRAFAALERYKAARRASQLVACAACFRNTGLRLAARGRGAVRRRRCPSCGRAGDKLLTRGQLEWLAHRFFVWGSLQRTDYGAAPIVQFNTRQKSNVDLDFLLTEDIHVFERALDVGFFYYGPRLWMIGEVEPLKALQSGNERSVVIQRIVTEYPQAVLNPEDEFFRIRLRPDKPTDAAEYDSPPPHLSGEGRLDAINRPVLYGSTDLEVCVHECRVTADDEIYVATLQPTRPLRLLNLSCVLEEEGVTEFESLDLAVHMLFLAGKHAYEHTRAVANAAEAAGFDGLIFPSYFSLLRVGTMPFETAYGLSVRRFPGANEREGWKSVPNIALFGRPIEHGMVRVACINRLVLRRVSYEFEFGPAIDMEELRAKGRKALDELRTKVKNDLQSIGEYIGDERL